LEEGGSPWRGAGQGASGRCAERGGACEAREGPAWACAGACGQGAEKEERRREKGEEKMEKKEKKGKRKRGNKRKKIENGKREVKWEKEKGTRERGCECAPAASAAVVGHARCRSRARGPGSERGWVRGPGGKGACGRR